MTDVVVVGSCMTDLISYVPRLPKPGETLHGHKFVVGFGGKGANQCIVSKRLGASTAMVAKLGDDTFGKNYLKNFKDNGVNIDHVSVTSEASTGVAPIAVSEEGENSIVIVSGANLILSERDLEKAETLIKSAKVMICQLEISASVTIAALKLAKKYNVKTIFNPAPAQAELDLVMYTLCDIICPNETEAEILTGLQVKNAEDAKKAIALLLGRGAKTVIITLGGEGIVFADNKNPVAIHIPVEKVNPVDTTGAGDAFIGALAFYLSTLPDLDLKEAIKRSSQIATVSVLKQGTQTSYPWQKDLPKELFSS